MAELNPANDAVCGKLRALKAVDADAANELVCCMADGYIVIIVLKCTNFVVIDRFQHFNILISSN